MGQIAQLNSGLAGKFWVNPQNFNSERNFVGYALTARLLAAPKLKIVGVIVAAVAILVVNILFGAQATSKGLLHDHLMHVSLNAAASANSNLHVPTVADMSFVIDGSDLSPTVSTLDRAELLRFVVAGYFPGFVSASSALSNFAAILTRKSRWGFSVHEGQYIVSISPAKETF